MSTGATYKITGGKPLIGSVRVGGAKNASYKLMIAALLGSKQSTLLNFSRISDVELVASCINQLGAKATVYGERAYLIDPRGLDKSEIPKEFGEGSRASTMFIGPLLAKFGKAVVPLPGGDKIGVRPLGRHYQGLEALGATVTQHSDRVELTTTGLKGNTYEFAKNTHTGTETLIMAAVKAEGTTVLKNAAEEIEVDDLITFLNNMGAKITRSAPREITIEGVKNLSGGIHKIMPDQNQVISFACAAIASKGDIVIENTRAAHLSAFINALKKAGAGYEIGPYGMRFFYQEPLLATDIITDVYPGFKTDWQPLWVTMMTQAAGSSTLHETVTQSRFQYVESLINMGAQIELFNPQVENPEQTYNFELEHVTDHDFHAAKITGPTPLSGTEVTIKDLRHGATMLIAGIIASGESVIHDPDGHIDRGYEQIENSFSSLGATISRVTK
jgi:UDP-N-acetylglucosamine 1-carboxyvinyltransferase